MLVWWWQLACNKNDRKRIRKEEKRSRFHNADDQYQEFSQEWTPGRWRMEFVVKSRQQINSTTTALRHFILEIIFFSLLLKFPFFVQRPANIHLNYLLTPLQCLFLRMNHYFSLFMSFLSSFSYITGMSRIIHG